MKKLLLFLVVVALDANAQDVIVKKDGSTIIAKVLEINASDIKYKKISNPNGPMYTINRSDVMSINYENGDKDSFDDIAQENKTSTSSVSNKLIDKPADSRNAELISIYNRKYEPVYSGKKIKKAKNYLLILGVKSSSIMSNEDIEMNFVRVLCESPYGGKYTNYYINLKNKSNKIIYIDKGNCFRINNDGSYHSYYDNSKQETITIGGENGSFLGLGSVAGILGIGGVIGQIASGTSIGGGTTHSTSTTFNQQRILSIPPQGNRNLTEEAWIKTKKGNLLSDAEYETYGEAEYFDYIDAQDIGLKSGMLDVGQFRLFSEDELPWKREYIIVYSNEEDFKTYSAIKTELYIHEAIGHGNIYEGNKIEKVINNINKHTITSWHGGE